MNTDRISKEELIRIYKIELSFFEELEASGLVHTVVADNIQYLLYDDLAKFEKLANWYYDLEVNIPGLEIISELMNKIEALKIENRKIISKL